VGDLQAVATREDTPTDKGVAFFNASTNRFETNTNTKVNASGQLVDTTIRNSGVAVIPLAINAVASTTADLQIWQVNSVNQARIDSNGNVRSLNLSNPTLASNARVNVTDTGTQISRNTADANPSLIVNLANASSTGNITNFQFAGANKLEITRDGFLTQDGVRFIHQSGGDTNTFFGTSSGTTGTTGTLNTGSGRNALGTLSSGSRNTGFGYFALRNVATSSNNTAFGSEAGRSITSGSSNTFLGRDAGNNTLQLATATNSTAIGNEAYTDASNQMVFGNASVTQFKFDKIGRAHV
jgi:hypothetical protein